MHVTRAPLSPTIRHAFPTSNRYANRGAKLPQHPPASVIAAEQRKYGRSVDSVNISQAGYRGHRQTPSVGARGILRAYDSPMATTSTSVNTALNDIARLRELRSNHPSTRGHHTTAAEHRGRPSHHQIPLTPEQARWFPIGGSNRYTTRPREGGPKIQSLRAAKKVRIMSTVEVIPSIEVQPFPFPVVVESTPRRKTKSYPQLEVPNIDRIGSGHPMRYSKELPPTPDMGFDEWGQVQRESNLEYTTDARFVSMDCRTKTLRRRSSCPNLREVAVIFAEKEVASPVSSSANTLSSKSSGIKGFIRKVRLSLTSDKKPARIPIQTPVVKVTAAPPQPKPKDDCFSWNIFKTTKVTNPGTYGRKTYYGRRGHTL